MSRRHLKTEQIPPVRCTPFLLDRARAAALVCGLDFAAFVRRSIEAGIRAAERRAGHKIPYPGHMVLKQDVEHAIRALERAADITGEHELRAAAITLRDSAYRTLGTAPREEREEIS